LNKTNVLFGFALAFWGGCTSPPVDSPPGRIEILVSIPPQKQFVEAVGGEFVRVHVLIPPGASPATYEPRPADLIRVEEADVYFRVGYIGFELANKSRLSALNPRMRMVDTSAGVPLRHFDKPDPPEASEVHTHPEIVDPHVWLSPLNVKQQVLRVAAVLGELSPEHKQYFTANAQAYSARLEELHQDLTERLSVLNSRSLLVFHPAWGYFTDTYGLEQIAIEQAGKDPTAEKLKDVIEEARASGIRVIFVQEEFSRETARSIAQEIHGAVVSIDPLAEDYIRNLRSVGRTLARYLGSKE